MDSLIVAMLLCSMFTVTLISLTMARRVKVRITSGRRR